MRTPDSLVALIHDVFDGSAYPGDNFLQGSYEGSEPAEIAAAFRDRDGRGELHARYDFDVLVLRDERVLAQGAGVGERAHRALVEVGEGLRRVEPVGSAIDLAHDVRDVRHRVHRARCVRAVRWRER